MTATERCSTQDFRPDDAQVDALLAAAGAEVVGHTITEADVAPGRRSLYCPSMVGKTDWSLSWRYGGMELGFGTEPEGRRMAALFIHLWERGVDCGLARDLAVCFVEAARRADEARAARRAAKERS